MKIPKSLQNLMEAFERLPGIGPKTAQRLAFYMLRVPEEELNQFSTAVSELKSKTYTCSICKNIGENNPCEICTDTRRDRAVLAVVESPLDVLAFERAGFKGLYHVLHGVISPLNNIGPDDIYIHDLMKRLKTTKLKDDPYMYLQSDLLTTNVNESVTEIILATNTNLEGESTSMFISKLILDAKEEVGEIKISRIARGLPVGGDIEYADDITLKRALEGRAGY